MHKSTIDHKQIPIEISCVKTILLILTMLLCITHSALAASSDSISSVYRDGRFETHYQKRSVDYKNINSAVADYLVADFHNSPGHLFEWALKDLGLQNKNNELIIVFKSSNHDTKTGITHGVFDIIVPHFTTFSNVKVDAIVTKTKYTNGVIKVTAQIIYSSLLLKNATGTISFIPQKNNELYIVTKSDINFGWFFNIFITQKRYKSIVEWRIRKFTENVIDECELRMKKDKTQEK